ncbi:hypothetical protein SDC9_122549 [bioreactor metagenome]|uniref:Uncharacterized protein n=1 Tax=bioreactor metagenome TaxID=1076179 RepID=A0A645CF77_9ZZZZ
MNSKKGETTNFFDINIVYINNNISNFEQIQNKLSDVLERIQEDSAKAVISAAVVPD